MLDNKRRKLWASSPKTKCATSCWITKEVTPLPVGGLVKNTLWFWSNWVQIVNALQIWHWSCWKALLPVWCPTTQLDSFSYTESIFIKPATPRLLATFTGKQGFDNQTAGFAGKRRSLRCSSVVAGAGWEHHHYHLHKLRHQHQKGFPGNTLPEHKSAKEWNKYYLHISMNI